MALDDLGNARIDFVWGNMPLQPNYDFGTETNFRGYAINYPGDGEAEYFYKGHNFGITQSQFLDAKDSHKIALTEWASYPEFSENDGSTLVTQDVPYNYWWGPGDPAAQMPNFIGQTVDEALAQLREIGVNPDFLTDLLNDGENPYTGGTPINSGIVIWHYYEPGTQIGTHWDGSPWYAEESENCVEETDFWPGAIIPVDSTWEDGVPWQWTFSVIQTKDPNKNSWDWWY